MQAGRFEAKVFDYYATTSKSGNPQVKVVFELVDTQEKVTAFLGLGEKSIQHTLKALITLGMREPNMEALEQGAKSGLLDQDTTVNITIEMQEYNGKTSPKVKWINPRGRGQEQRQALDAQAKQALSGLNGAFAMAMAKEGITPKFNADEGVPF